MRDFEWGLIPRFIWLVIIWFLGLFVFLPLFFVGAIVVPIMALLKRFEWGTTQRGRQAYIWKERWMRMWETDDNGCCPQFYINRFSKRPLWLNVVYWCGFRNPVGGNPLHVAGIKTTELRVWGNAMTPDVAGIKEFLNTGKRKWKWRFIQHGWCVGFWASYPFMRQYEKDPTDKFDVIDIQFGYKISGMGENTGEIKLKYSPWDSGRRMN